MSRSAAAVLFAGLYPALAACSSPQPVPPPGLPGTLPPAASPTPTSSTLRALAPDDVQSSDRARIDALSLQANQVLDVYSNGSPVLSRDGSSLAFRSNRSGTPSPLVASASDPSAAPRRIADSEERVSFLARPPGTTSASRPTAPPVSSFASRRSRATGSSQSI